MTLNVLIAEMTKWSADFGHLPVLRDADGAPTGVQWRDLWGGPTVAAGVRLVTLWRHKPTKMLYWEKVPKEDGTEYPAEEWEKGWGILLD